MTRDSSGDLFHTPENKIPGLSVIAAGRIIHKNFDFEGFRILNHYAAVYVSRGRGEYYGSPGTSPVELREGSLFFLYPGTAHRYGPVNGSWTQYWIVYDGVLADLLKKEASLEPEAPVLTPANKWDVQSSFEEIMTLNERKVLNYRIQTSSILYRLLLSVIPGISETGRILNAKEQLSEEIKERLQENLLTRRTVKDILNIRGYSYNYLRTVFKEQSGFSPARYLIRQRIEYVCEQLSFSNQSIKEIAYNAGFDDPQYFSRVFKKTTGISPGQYRKSIFSYTED